MRIPVSRSSLHHLLTPTAMVMRSWEEGMVGRTIGKEWYGKQIQREVDRRCYPYRPLVVTLHNSVTSFPIF
jgi:hypothetical protein